MKLSPNSTISVDALRGAIVTNKHGCEYRCTDLDQQQKEYFLNQQMKAIQEELGGSGSHKEVEEMRKLASKKKWNKDIADA